VFYVTANPLTAVKTSNLNIIKDPNDADGDGVSDSDDEYPSDAGKVVGMLILFTKIQR